MMFLKVANVSSAAMLGEPGPSELCRVILSGATETNYGPDSEHRPEIKSEKFAIMITNKLCEPPGRAGLNSCQTNFESG